ncbi:hypothetical protein NKDENANG_03702 [Candidatus Entotheonellaceae bacterium PAL068K]
MGSFPVFVIGIAVGVAITWQASRRRGRQVAAGLSVQLTQAKTELRVLKEQQDAANRLRQPGAVADATVRAWQDEAETASDGLSTVIILERLEHIPGITPRVARRLNQAGILTYADLARQAPERLRTLISSGEPGDMPVHDWIVQARALTREVDLA